MADEIGDGSYSYVSHIGVYVLGRVALRTGDPDGFAEARRALRPSFARHLPVRPASASAPG
jgi:hypothetical protein